MPVAADLPINGAKLAVVKGEIDSLTTDKDEGAIIPH